MKLSLGGFVFMIVEWAPGSLRRCRGSDIREKHLTTRHARAAIAPPKKLSPAVVPWTSFTRDRGHRPFQNIQVCRHERSSFRREKVFLVERLRLENPGAVRPS